MKYKYFFIGLLSAMMVSCSINELTSPEQDIYNQSPNVVYAVIEDESGDVDTKVYADSKLRVLWNEDDYISYFAKTTYNGQYIFLGEDGDNAGSFAEVPNSNPHTGNEVSYHYAVYPYQLKTSLSNDEIIRFTLPAKQAYKKDSFGIGANTMASKTATNELKFKNVGGYLSFKFYGEGVSVSSITLRGNNGEKLAGKCTIDMSSGEPAVIMDQEKATEEITLTCDPPVALNASSTDYVEFWMVVPPTTFSKGITFTVTTPDGGVWEKQTTASFSLTRNVKRSLPALEVEVTTLPEAVDLGLSVKWASFNLGATKPEEYGDYFAWAETSPYYYYDNNGNKNFSSNQQGYDWGTYQWISLGKETTNIKRYCPSVLRYDYRWTGSGDPDDKTEFADYNYVNDAARANWQGEWRTPSEAEWSELLNNCTWEWEENYNETGVNGYLVTGTKSGYTNNSIFLPAAGWYRKTYLDYKNYYGNYWSSSLYTSRPDNAWYLGFSMSSSGNVYMQYSVRPGGFSVRPVVGVPVLVTSVHLNCYNVSLYEGDSFTLSATVSPSDIVDQAITWVSSDPSVVSVNNGILEAISEGAATITVTRGGKDATCDVNVFRRSSTTEAIDLGLNVKWASCNVGATKPEEYGDYFAWGEKEPYYQPDYAQSENPVWKSGKEAGYAWQSYGWCNGSEYTLTRYCTSGETGYWGGSDNPDGKRLLSDYNYDDDAARANWQGEWRTPTPSEWSELKSKCEWIKTSLCGVNGYVITSKINGKRIFLPAAGYRYQKSIYGVGTSFSYWTSRISSDPPSYAFSLSDLDDDGDRRYYGFSIRPVIN